MYFAVLVMNFIATGFILLSKIISWNTVFLKKLSRPASEETPRLLKKPEFYYDVHKTRH
jgi:hypothetical protein